MTHGGPKSLLLPRFQDNQGAVNIAFNERIKQMRASGKPVYHMGFGQSPFPMLETGKEALKEFVAEKSYLPTEGILPLRKMICRFHKKYDGLDFDPENVVVGPGSKELLFLLITVFNGDILLVSPTWPTYKPQVKFTKDRFTLVETSFENGWRLTPASIDKVISDNDMSPNKLIVICNPDNPTGTSYSAKEIKALTTCFREHSIYVISDEIYGRLNYNDDHVSFAKYYPEGTILSSGISKWASAGGWRVGYAIYPAQLWMLREAVRNAGSNSYSCCPSPMQYAVTKMLEDEEAVEDFIRHTTRILKLVAEFVFNELTSVGIKVIKPDGAYYCFPDFEVLRPAFDKRGIKTGMDMCEAILKEASVALMAGGPAFLRPRTELTVRLCFVDFDGKIPLDASRAIGFNSELGQEFVPQYCGQIYDGIKALRGWVEEQLKDL